jgi:dipeptidase E
MRLKRLHAIFLFVAAFVVAIGAHDAAAAPSVMLSGGTMMNGDHFADSNLAALREHFAGCRHIALVLHASAPADRDRMERRLQRAFAHLSGAKAESLHHRDAAGQRALLESADGIFVSGGETFVLLAELYRLEQLDVIRARVAAGVPYLGTSAGSNVAGLLIGTTNDFPVAEIPSRQALGIFPAVINPHHPLPTDAEFKGRANKIGIYLKFNPGERVLGIGNTSLVRLRGSTVTVAVGTAWLYRSGDMKELRAGDAMPELLEAAR